MMTAVTRTAAADWADAKVLTQYKSHTADALAPLNLWVSTPGGRLHLSQGLHIRYSHYESEQ